jgi:hypothetical protein
MAWWHEVMVAQSGQCVRLMWEEGRGGATWVKVGRPKNLAIRLVHQGSWATKGFGPKVAIKKRIHFFLFGFYSNNFDSHSNDF